VEWYTNVAFASVKSNAFPTCFRLRAEQHSFLTRAPDESTSIRTTLSAFLEPTTER
jgi:hypothetical protein